MTICYKLNNYVTDICNSQYIFNNNYTTTQYGLYETSGNVKYSIYNIPKKYPLGIFSSTTNDISNIIEYDVSYETPIIIYVSKGNDISFNNGDFFRFYDDSFNLINITNSTIDTTLTNSGDNFYFMRKMKYKFIATVDFSSTYQFDICGNELTAIGSSFELIIPDNVNNSNNKIYYTSNNDISDNLNILVDSSNNDYYYGNIILTVYEDFSSSDISLSIQSFPEINNNIIKNNDFFKYNNECYYIISGDSNIADNLASISNECLNIVSRANFISSNNYLGYYEFNSGNHGSSSIINTILPQLNYGICDNSYTIFNIDERYPITIANNDISKNIYIDKNYHRTLSINKNSIFVSSLTDNKFKNYDYYYGAIRIIIDNSNETLNDLSSIPIYLLDLLNLQNTRELSNNFIYRTLCENPNNVNMTGNIDICFVLFNQENNQFDNNNNNESNNIYKLNKYERYISPNPSYFVRDKYGHDISNLVIHNEPENIENINYDISKHIITYKIQDYQDNYRELNRIIEIQEGPYIEFSGNLTYFKNLNQYTNHIIIDTNTYVESYNFFNNLDVYIYDNSRNKINLPFNITLSGEKYDISKNIENIEVDNIATYNVYTDTPLKINDLTYYLSYNIYFQISENESELLNISETGLQLFNINDISYISNETSNLLNNTEVYQYNSENNQIILGKSGPRQIQIYDIDNDNSIIYIKNVNTVSNGLNISGSIYLTNNEFSITLYDLDDATNNVTIDGSFNPINFFLDDRYNKYIDLSYIGKYDINITVKGLNQDDYIYNDISNIISNNRILDFSRTFVIDVIDNISPELFFINNGSKTTIYEYNYPKSKPFNILHDISFIKKNSEYQETSSKPIIEFDDNSIYDCSLDYSIYDSTGNEINRSEILASDSNIDASYIIIYSVTDLCNNKSNDISLTINFIDIPEIDLSGDNPIIININTDYRDPGIIIGNENYYPNSILNDPSTNDIDHTDGNINIEYSINIYTSQIGLYEISYNISKNDNTTYIIRRIIVTDNESPIIKFKNYADLSYIPYPYQKQEYNYVDTDANTDTDNMITDFSLLVYTPFSDLSAIIYDISLVDNYSHNSYLLANTKITISGGNDNYFSMSDISLDSYGNINKITNNDPIIFIYQVNDQCGNSTEVTRNVHIVDIISPDINFAFTPIHNNYTYVEFDLSYNDFSFEIFNHNIDSSLFLQELSSIIFNFEITDNYNTIEEISSNYKITISGIECNTYTDLSSEIGNIGDLFKQFDNSFDIIYDISDNQSNNKSITRHVTIINKLKPYITNYNDISLVRIEFGDLSYNIVNNINIFHDRLMLSDISFDISYILPSYISDLSGTYDVSKALIYNIGFHDISFFPVIYNENFQVIGDICNIYVNIYNQGPKFNNSDIQDIQHEAGYYISDLSLLVGITAYSRVDDFYYYHNNPDISYTETNFTLNINNSNISNTIFNQDKPKVGEYNIIYTANDICGIIVDISRILIVEDTIGPEITLFGDENIKLNLNEQYYEPGLNIRDIGSDLSNVKIQYYKNNNTQDISTIRNINSFNIKNECNIQISLINQISSILDDTSYTIIYTATDIYDNVNSKERYIEIESEADFIIETSIHIRNSNTLEKHIKNLNANFNVNLNELSNNIYLNYNNLNRTITYEATSIQNFNDNISFDLSASYDNVTISENNISIYHNIIADIVGNYYVIFQVFNSEFEVKTITINFNVIDSTPPRLRFVPDISFILLPLLSDDNVENLKTNINLFDNLIYNIRFLNISDNIIFSLPGIEISDIVNKTTISLSNETLQNNTRYKLEIKYIDISDSNDISNHYILTRSTSSVYNQIYTVNELYIFDENTNLNSDISSSITRKLKIQRFEPYIELLNDSRYNKLYHEQYYIYRDKLGKWKDYYDGIYDLTESNIIKNIDSNTLGIQEVIFTVTNTYNQTSSTSRSVHVVNILCLPLNVSNFYNYITSYIDIDINNIYSSNNNVYSSDTKFGLYDNSYIIQIDNSENPIRLFGYDFNNNTDYVYSNEIDISNLINISGEFVVERNIDNINYKYYWGKININVFGDFNRASIEYLNDSNSVFLSDIFLYSEKCQSYKFIDKSELRNNYMSTTIIIDISGINIINEDPYFIFDGEKKDTLVLSYGEYIFKQDGYRNFYNPIKFSYTDNSNIDNVIEYTKNVNKYRLPGLANSKTEILIDVTTPSPLYLYSKNFNKISNKIIIIPNIVITKNIISVNDNVLTIDNSNVLQSVIPQHLDTTTTNTNNITDTLKNKIFICQKFKLRHESVTNDTNRNYICLTQQNINHNIKIDKYNSKIIFKKYKSIQDNISGDKINHIKQDNSNNYLIDYNINNLKSNILDYHYRIDTSANLLQNTDNSKYEFDIAEIFYKDNRLDSYQDFFYKSYLINERIYLHDFKYKIKEISYINHVKLFDRNREYNYYNDEYLSFFKFIFDSIFDNILIFNLQIFLDLSNLDIKPELLNYLKNNISNLNGYSNYPMDNTNLLFNEFMVSIYSDISGDRNIITPTERQSLVLSNGIIELDNNLLDSSGSRNLLDNNESSNILQNKIFLSTRDASNNNYVGLTQQNIFHNIFIDDDNKFIFHKYNNAINVGIQYDGLTLQKTLEDSSNNKNYLLEISNNDVYNCFVDNSKNIYNNYLDKNENFRDDIDKEYKCFITYFILNELHDSNDILKNLDIRSITLNNINYQLYPYAYSNYLNSLHSHSYIINLNNYFDRLLYTDESNNIPYNVINLNNLYYKITDISYLYDFNIFDLDIQENIIYDKNKIYKLNYLQNYIYITNLKLDFIVKLLIINDKQLFENNNNYSITNYKFIYDVNIQNLSTIFNELNQLSTNYNLILTNNSLNTLYSNNFYNTKVIIKKYNDLTNIFSFYHIINKIDDQYINILNFDNIDQMITDISNINININEVIYNYNSYYRNFDGIQEIFNNNIENIVIEIINVFNTLLELLINYNTLIENYDILFYEYKLRDDAYQHQNIYYNLKYLYDISYSESCDNISQFYNNLLENYTIMNEMLINDLSGDTNLNFINDELSYSIDYNIIGISNNLTQVNDHIDYINQNYDTLYNRFDLLYDINKELVFNKINYILNGSNLLINSFKSNNILLKLDIIYNSYLYPNTYLDTIVLDIAIPDYVPPTIIFNREEINFSQNLSTDISINLLIDLLLDDISYIDINQEYNDYPINESSVNYDYINLSDSENNRKINVVNNIYSLIEIDISNIYNINFQNKNSDYANIVYKVKDNINNENIITRRVLVNKSFSPVLIYYNNILINTFDNIPLLITQDSNRDRIEALAKRNIKIIDPQNNNTEIFNHTTNIDTGAVTINILFINNIPNTVVYNIINNLSIEIEYTRLIEITDLDDTESVKINCCWPKVYYKNIQHNYKLGSSASNVSRLSKIILNNTYF